MKKILFIALVLLFFALLACIGFLPNILSSRIVQHALLEHLSTDSAVTLSIGSCEVSWRQGIFCTDVVYANTEHGLEIQAVEVSGEQGLLALLAAPRNVGVVRVEHPVVTLNSQSPAAPPSVSPELSVPPSIPHVFPEKKREFWDVFAGTLVFEKGRLLMPKRAGENVALAGDISGALTLDAGTVQHDLHWLAGDGSMSAQGYVNLPGRRQHLFDAMVVRTKLLVTDMEFTSLLPLIADFRGVPRGKGLVSGELTITASGLDSIDVVGELHGRNIILSGGVLGEDQPRLGKMSFWVDGSVSEGKYWRVGKFDVEGDYGAFTLTGTYGENPGRLRLTGDVYLPVLFAQFLHLFRVRPETRVEEGRIKFFSELSTQQAQQELVVDLMIDPLKGVQGQQPFTWENGFSLALSTTYSDEGFVLKRLDLSSAFLTAEGKGHSQDFSFQLGAELEKAGNALGKVFVLPWSGKGKLELEVRPAVADMIRYGVDFQLTSPKISLSRNRRVVLPEYPLRIQGKFDFPENGEGKQAGAVLKLAGSLWPGTFALTLENIQYTARQLTGGYALSADMELDRMRAVVDESRDEAKHALKGTLQVAAAGFLTEDQLLVRELDVGVTNYTYQRNEVSVAEKQLSLQTRRPPVNGDVPVAVFPLQTAETLQSWQAQGSGLSGYDWSEQLLFMRNMDLRTSSVDLKINELVVDDLWDPDGIRRAELVGEESSQAGRMVVKKELHRVFPALFSGGEM